MAPKKGAKANLPTAKAKLKAMTKRNDHDCRFS